jgi:hypothetical protein
MSFGVSFLFLKVDSHVSMKPPLDGIIQLNNILYCNIPTKTLVFVISRVLSQEQSCHDLYYPVLISLLNQHVGKACRQEKC